MLALISERVCVMVFKQRWFLLSETCHVVFSNIFLIFVQRKSNGFPRRSVSAAALFKNQQVRFGAAVKKLVT